MGIDRTNQYTPVHRRVFLAVLLLFLYPFAAAQAQPDYKIVHYSTGNGLIQNSAGDVLLDTNGFLWIATQGGLCRFDGMRFRLYNSSNSPMLADRVSHLTQTSSGKVLVHLAFERRIIYRINKEYMLEEDTALSTGPPVFYGKGGDPVRLTAPNGRSLPAHLLGDVSFSNGSMPLDEHRLYYFHDGKIRLFDNRTGLSTACASIANPRLATVVEGLYVCFDDHLKGVAIRDGVPLLELPLSPAFHSLMQRMRADPDGVIAFYRNNNHFTLVHYNDEIWMMTLSNGSLDVSLLYSGLRFTHTYYCLYDPVNDILYAGTDIDGLYVVSRNRFRTIILDDKVGYRNTVYAQIRVSKDFVANQYYRYDPNRDIRYPLKQELPVCAFYKTSDGRIVYSDQRHVFFADSAMRVTDSLAFPDPNIPNIIGAFLEDKQRRLWFASFNSVGYIRDRQMVYKLRDDSFFLRNKISVLFPYDEETMWIGCGKGIVVYDKKRDRLLPVVFLPDNDIRSIYRARDSSIWIGTYGKGFYKYTGNRFTRMPLDEHQYLLFTHSFNEDRNGFFWLPTNNGLFQCRKAELDTYAAGRGKRPVYYYYYKDCGLYTNEFNGGSDPMSVWMGNQLLLPTINGVLTFVPDSAKPYFPNNKILLESVRCDNRQLPAGQQLYLPPGFKRLELIISTPYMGDQLNNVLEYNLKESGAAWYPLDKSGIIAYNQLPHGVYHLTIRKRTGFGVNDYAVKTIVLHVAPFWYGTFTFYLFLGLGLVGVVYYVFKLRERAFRKRKALLEQTVQDRTADLNKTVRELHESEKILSNINLVQEQVISAILHDVQTPLRFMSSSALHFNRNLTHFSLKEISEFAGALSHSASEINNFTNDLLQWLIYQQGNLGAVAERIDAQELLQEIRSLYEDIIAFDGNTMELSNDGPVWVVTDRNKLKLVIRNLVDNANKNCREGYIRLSARAVPQSHTIELSVEDTGNGMTEDKIRELLNNVHGAYPSFKKGKLGYVLIRDFLKIIGGRLEIRSEKGKGTTVTVILPGNMEPGVAGSSDDGTGQQ